MESKHPAFWAGHTFSVVTGTAFVISAVLNAVTFWLTWKLNYFLIASPADVVMSGFILVATVAVVAAVIVGIWWFFVTLMRLSQEERRKRLKEVEELNAAIERSIESMRDRLLKAGLPADEIDTISSAQRMGRRQQAKIEHVGRRASSAFKFATVIVSVLGLLAPVAKLLGRVPDVNGAVEKISRPWWYATGLQVAPEYKAFEGKCANAPVAWLGSSTAILECSDRVRVIHKLDDLVTVQRYAR